MYVGVNLFLQQKLNQLQYNSVSLFIIMRYNHKYKYINVEKFLNDKDKQEQKTFLKIKSNYIYCLLYMNVSKLKFPIHTSKNKQLNQKTQEHSPYVKTTERRFSQKGKQILVPIEKLTQRQTFRVGKALKSQGRSLQKQQPSNEAMNILSTKMGALELITLKNSLVLKKQRQSLQLVAISKKRVNTNRLITQNITKTKQKEYDSSQKANNNSNRNSHHLNNFLTSTNKFTYRKMHSKQTNNPADKYSNRNVIRLADKANGDDQKKKINLLDINPNTTPDKNSSVRLKKTSLSKRQTNSSSKTTPFQREEMTNYEVHFIGTRRINSQSDFTDHQGDPKVLIGDSIAYKYEIVQILGRGSFGKVFKAFDHKKKQFIALKIIKSQPKFTTQAKIEVEILQTALLHDPKLRCNLVRMKNSFNFRGHACITFELLHKNLYEFLKDTNFSGFSLDLIRRFAIQILQTLMFFSQFKMIHCDLKPQNILLKQENKSGIRVIDVGSGCFEPNQLYTYIQSRFYRAPEIILGIKYTCAIDMWSFGCILVELYTGYPLFPGSNQNQQMLMFIELLGQPPYAMLEIAERRKKFFTEKFQCKIPQQKGKQRICASLTTNQVLGDCDPEFIDLVNKCLQWDPKKRITPKEALLHKWIINGLPVNIRNQHIQQVTTFAVK